VALSQPPSTPPNNIYNVWPVCGGCVGWQRPVSWRGGSLHGLRCAAPGS
jgi:hypothetical protein